MQMNDDAFVGAAANKVTVGENRGAVEMIVDHTSDAIRDAAQSASHVASDAYEGAKGWTRSATNAVSEQISNAPLLNVLMIGGIGFALGYVCRASMADR
jgi:hypothetical protein